MKRVNLEAVKELREKTGAGVMECKKALEEAEGDMEKAVALLRERGLAIASRKEGRETRQGLIEAYVHHGNRIGAMVEVNCESDFVARTVEFRELAHSLAMQVAATNPLYVDKDQLPPDRNLNPEEVCLLDQPYIKDPTKKVKELITDAIALTRENIRVKRFARFEVGN